MRFSILFVNWSFIFLLSWITYNDLNLFSNFWVHLFFPLGAVIILMFYWGPLFAKCLASIISSNSQLLCEEVRDIFPPDIERVMFFPRSHFYLWHQLGVSSDTSYPELASASQFSWVEIHPLSWLVQPGPLANSQSCDPWWQILTPEPY